MLHRSDACSGALRLIAAFALFSSAATADEASRSPSTVHQYRTADGEVIFSDRPIPGAVLQHSWRADSDDPGAIRRRDEARREAAAVSERIQRSIEADRQREHELALARLQLAAAAEATRAAALARDEAAARSIVITRPVHLQVPQRRHGFRPEKCPFTRAGRTRWGDC